MIFGIEMRNWKLETELRHSQSHELMEFNTPLHVHLLCV